MVNHKGPYKTEHSLCLHEVERCGCVFDLDCFVYLELCERCLKR